MMRTSLDFPDPLFRHLKARAAMEGSTLRDLILSLVEIGLNAPAVQSNPTQAVTALPTISLGAPMALSADELSNAGLADLLNE